MITRAALYQGEAMQEQGAELRLSRRSEAESDAEGKSRRRKRDSLIRDH